MEINSLDMRYSPTGVLLSTSISSKAGSEGDMRAALETLTAAAKEDPSNVATMAVNQDPDERNEFFVLQRFPSVAAMSAHRSGAAHKVRAHLQLPATYVTCFQIWKRMHTGPIRMFDYVLLWHCCCLDPVEF